MDSNNIKMHYSYSTCALSPVKYIICYVEGCNKIKIAMLECLTWKEKIDSNWKRNLLNVVKAAKTENTNKNGLLVLSR